ncbi:protein FAM13A [Anopheles nili]|uniref:protein FAM13A n=1 Tax=Anopheles nili TaxID=185578 RepID=UPI00237BE2C1|nr:protein FAM13A [Anopheles nili]
MRRPSLGQNEDDLSRLTTIISPTSISLSSNGLSDPVVVVVANEHHDVVSCGRSKANSISSSSSSSSSSSTNGASNTTSNSTSNCPASINSIGAGDVGADGSSTGSRGSSTSNSISDGVKETGGKNSSHSSSTCSASVVGGGGCGSSLPPPTVLVNQYLPNLINSSEWQNCRKRKERQDSTSSISQDRKLIRSNSEEHLPNCQEVIRRVSSHEDFKKRAAGVVSVEISIDKENIITEEAIEGDGEDEGQQLQQQQVFEKNLKNSADDLKKFFIGSVENVGNGSIGKEHQSHHHHHHGNHTYHHLGGHHHSHHLHHTGGKALQQSHHRLSPCRDILKSRRDSDSEQDGEHERRRHCERFSKTRPPPGRKSVSPRARSSSKHSKLAAKAATAGGTVLLAGNEQFYSKHDTHPSGGKSDRRRSSSKHREQQLAVIPHDSDTPMGDINFMPLSDYNDNNVLEKNQAVEEAAAQETIALIDEQTEVEEQEPEPLSPREKLPWGQSYPDDMPAIVCQRFSDDKFDHATRMDSVSHAKLRPVSSGGSLKLYGAHHRSAETAPPSGMHHHHHHQKPGATPAANNMFDDRIKAINRKLGGLKKKLTQFEDRYEREHGSRPTHVDKSADPSIKSIVVEMHKLRKEKNQIKADLVVFSAKATSSSSQRSSGEITADDAAEENRLAKMKDTITDIEKRLSEKRDIDHRSENLDLLSNEQLTEEKASVQRALLYLESMYGRPASREERDAARPLYDRYRVIKRLVNRANSISGPCGVANSQMPTILEHEALAIVGTTTPSTDISPPSATSMLQSPTDGQTAGPLSTDESEGTATTTSGSVTENIHSMTTDELWQHYDATREEKKELRRTIKDFEQQFEETTGRKMLKSDRKAIEDTYALYKQKKAKLRLIDALFKKQMHA